MGSVGRLLDPNLVERLNQLQLSARRVVEGPTVGLHRSALKGSSIEFRQHRFYAPGDEPRRLDWRVLARTDRPYIKEYDEETNVRCLVLLDHSGSMGYGGKHGAKLDYAAQLVASLAYLMLSQTESVGLATFGQGIDGWLAPHGHSSQLSRVIDVLERLTPDGASDPRKAMHDAADRLGRRNLVVVVSDLFTPSRGVSEGLARLHHERHELIVIRVLDRDELEFPFRSFARFRGLEGETPVLCETALVRKQYLSNFRTHEREVQDACRALGAQFAMFVTDVPMIDALTLFLRRRAGA